MWPKKEEKYKVWIEFDLFVAVLGADTRFLGLFC